MSSLKTVNRSTPQLVHTPSKQSVTASDDYYSLGSDASSNDEHTTVLLSQFQTPPSHMQSREMLHAPTIRPVGTQLTSTIQRPPGVHFDTNTTQTIRKKPVSSEGIVAQRAADPELSPPTPGIDDTPFLHFAIDQLTRDEELLGLRRPGAASDASYQVERETRNPNLGQIEHRDISSRPERQSSDTVIRHPNTHGESDVLERSIYWTDSLIESQNIFLPTEPSGGYRYPPLEYVPLPLRIASLGSLLLCCLAMIALIIFCNVQSMQHNGLLQYDGVATPRYFLFQFLPQILASIIVLWLLTIQITIARIFPFTALASGHGEHTSTILHTAALFPSDFMIPNLFFFKHSEPVLGVCSIIFWLVLFTVPLQSCLFQTRYYTLDAQSSWRWTSVQAVGWTLLVLYILMIAALVLLILRFSRRRQTGLKWDATSLADILTLVHRSNILSDFEGSEIRSSMAASQMPKQYRLGYWRTSVQPENYYFHSLGEANAPVNRYSIEQGKMKAKASDEKNTGYASYDIEGQRPWRTSTLDSLQKDIHSTVVQRQWIPWFLKETLVVAWIVIAIVLTIAFVVVSYVNRAVELGFLPQLPAPATPGGFSPANFLYSFLPSLLGMILFLAWQPIDLYFRALQPFANLSQPRGATAENSLLLEYTACPPILVTIKAALAGHWKVAYISFISLLSITLPVLAGGVFTAQYFARDGEVRSAASMPAYNALVFFVIVYALSFLAIWPGRNRHLPHDVRTLGQLISFVYQSSLLHDAALKTPQTKTDLVTRLLGAEAGEKFVVPRYGFGVYLGMDGREHLGIDRLKRPGSGEMLITTGR